VAEAVAAAADSVDAELATRRIAEGDRLLRARRPWSFHLGFMLGAELSGKTLGIIGLGQIGQAVARRARAFGMQIPPAPPGSVK
jgi:lactate dehydrogenase-like 2-hydroxyacid dehydrogenase